MKEQNQFWARMWIDFENTTIISGPDGDVVVKGRIADTASQDTAAEQDVSSAFARLVRYGSTLEPFLNRYFKPSNSWRSPFNEFVAQISKIKEQLQDADMVERFRVLQVTQGPLYSNAITPASFKQPVFSDGKATITLNWGYDASSPGQDGTDKVMALEWNPVTGGWQAFDTGATRADGTVNLPVKAPAEGFNWYAVFRIKEQLQGNEHDCENSEISIQVGADEVVKYRENGWM